MTLTIMFWLHLTICPNHKLTSRDCVGKVLLCHKQLCLEYIAEHDPTSAIWSIAP